MESAESATPERPLVTSTPRATLSRAGSRPGIDTIVLQVDGTVTGIQGLAWLAANRDAAMLRRLSELQVEAMASGWSRAEFTRARLGCLRPRRAEVNALGRAYLGAIAPGAVDAAHRMRRAGVGVELSGEVGIEAMLGLADALGVTPDAIHAPRLRFDALGAYTGCDVGARAGASSTARTFVGTRHSELLVEAESDQFVRFTGFVAHEGPARGTSVASFAELAALVTT